MAEEDKTEDQNIYRTVRWNLDVKKKQKVLSLVFKLLFENGQSCACCSACIRRTRNLTD